MARYLRVATPVESLQTSIPRWLDASMSTRLHRASRVLNLDTSTSSGPQRDSRAPCLHVATPTARLQTSMARYYLHVATSVASLQTPIPRWLGSFNVCTSAARIQSSKPRCLNTSTSPVHSATPELH